MDIKQALKQYTSLRDEKDEVERRIRKLEKALERITEEGEVKDSVKGGYGGTQHFVIEGFPLTEFSDVRTALQKQKLRLTALQKEITDACDTAHEYINAVEDSEIRRILTFRYIYGYSWDKTARNMGHRATEDAVRMRIERYFSKKS